MFITVDEMDSFESRDLVRPGMKCLLEKEEKNLQDDEAIAVYLADSHVKCGYVANSIASVARGTHSAGYIYQSFDQKTQCTVRFVYDSGAIAELVTETEEKESADEHNE